MFPLQHRLAILLQEVGPGATGSKRRNSSRFWAVPIVSMTWANFS